MGLERGKTITTRTSFDTFQYTHFLEVLPLLVDGWNLMELIPTETRFFWTFQKLIFDFSEVDNALLDVNPRYDITEF